MKKFSLKVDENVTLYGCKWEVKGAKAQVILMEGMEEHLSRNGYVAFAEFLNKNGYSVYGLDTFGQGFNVKDDLSNIGMWPVDGFSKQVIANNVLLNKLKENKLPVYIFAHSMGSFMAQDYIQRFPGTAEKVVLCGSGSKNPAVKPGLLLAKALVNKKTENENATVLNSLMFGNFNKKISNPRTPFDWLTFNKDNVDEYIDDPLCGFGPKNRFCLEFLKGMSKLYVKKSLNKIDKDQKLLIISGSDDPVTSYGKSVTLLKKMYQKLGVRNVSTKIFKNMRHEILNETNCEEVYKIVIDFFDK